MYKPCRIIIFGDFTKEWMEAFSQNSPLWFGLENILEVISIQESDLLNIPMLGSKDALSVVIPLLENHALKLHGQLPNNFVGLFPSPNSIAILHDKKIFIVFLQEKKLDKFMPKIYRDIHSAQFPIVIKQRNLMAGYGVASVNSLGDYLHIINTPHWQNKDIILQSFVPGRLEYATHAMCAKGRILWHVTFSYRIKGACPIKGEFSRVITRLSKSNSNLMKILKIIVADLNYDGPLCADYKIVSGIPIIFEINPRFGGSLMWPRHVAYLQEAIRHLIKAAYQADSE